MKKWHNCRIFLVLVNKELKLLYQHFTSNIIDCLMPLCIQVLTFGYLFPLLGMPKDMIAPVYLGSMIPLLMQLGFAMVMRTAFDLEFNRFIDYHFTLPLPKKWLFGAYIVNHMIEVACVTIPLYTLGILALHSHFDFKTLTLLPFICMYSIILLYFATFFLAVSYTLSLHWILDNFWPRILTPLYWLSSTLIVWKKSYAWNPIIGSVMLLSPFTYISEGIRSSLLGSQEYIAWPLCALMLGLFTVINCYMLKYGIYKKLDPI